ncbi:MAG: (2Fe-2S)-binding protein, partial [Phenylobacterium sp.]|nr:(2Fe-2S)-binding protein [Phenylobacterium sp.]
HPTKGISQDAWRRFCAAEPGVDLDADWRKARNLSNNFLQDREAMKAGDFTGIVGIPAQDMAMWESMGPIADRSADHLGSSDGAIIQFRRQMVAAAKAVLAGEPAIGAAAGGTPHAHLASFEGLVPRDADWRAFTTRNAPPAAAAE